MKCENCGVVSEKNESDYYFKNIILTAFPLGMITVFVFPLDIEHGYSMNYDMLIFLGLMMVYVIYLYLVKHNKIKGTLVFWEKIK